MKAKFVQRSDSVDFIPTRDVEAGEIVRLGKLIGVTKMFVAAGTLGSLAISGIFDVVKSMPLRFAAGECVCCDGQGNVGGTGTVLGLAVQDSPETAGTVRILLTCAADAVNINISAENGNILRLNDDGIFVPPLEWKTVE